MIALVVIGLIIASNRLWAEESLHALIDNGNYQQAYALAKTQMDERVGDPDFDFMYALAALETGHPQEAIFALERVITAEDWDHRARLELGRAHFMLGNFELAKNLFNEVLASDPPPRVRENIKTFMDSLASRKVQRDQLATVGIDFKIGLDSNVNSATQSRTATSPFGLTLQLSDTSREFGDEFAELIFSGSYMKLLRKDMGVYAAATLNERHNASINQFDLRVAGVSAGYVYKSAGQVFRLPLQWQQLKIDRKIFRDSLGLGLEYGYERIRNQKIALFGQWSQQRHVEAEKTRDADLSLIGGAFSYNHLPWRSDLSVSAYSANEKALPYALPHNGRQYSGLRLSSLWHPQPLYELQFSWAKQSVTHDVSHAVFGVVREDSYQLFEILWEWKFNPSWRMSLMLSHAKNQSNIDIYTYARTQQMFWFKFNY